MWSADASNYRRVPIGVVAPRNTDDVEAAIAVCREHGVPVLPRGAGTSIGGQAVNTAVVLDFKHLNRILEVDRTRVPPASSPAWSVTRCGTPPGRTGSPSARTRRRTTAARSAG